MQSAFFFNLLVDVQIEQNMKKNLLYYVSSLWRRLEVSLVVIPVDRMSGGRVRGERVTSDYNCSGWQTGDCWFRNPPQKYWRNISPLMLMSVWVRREDKTVWTCFNFPAPFDCQSISPWVVRDHYPNIKTFTVYFTFHELKTSRALFSSENISYLN